MVCLWVWSGLDTRACLLACLSARRALPTPVLLQGTAVRKTSASSTMRLDAAKREHLATRAEMEAQARRAAKLDKKANILVTGLQQRHTKLASQLDDMAQQVCCPVLSVGVSGLAVLSVLGAAGVCRRRHQGHAGCGVRW